MNPKNKVSAFILYSSAFVITIVVMGVCLFLGSAFVSFNEAFAPNSVSNIILFDIRMPRVFGAFLVGASLSIGGAVMQGLLQNPLADGTTLGVSAGASLGAVIAIFTGFSLPFFPSGGVVFLSIIFAFVSLLVILTLSQHFDNSLSTQTIILLGIVFTMFANSIITLLTAFAKEKLRTITFWTMGSLANIGWTQCALLLGAAIICVPVLLSCSRELNAFAVGEVNARNIGVTVKKYKLLMLFTVSALTGVCVSVCGTIGFVGLIIPHIARLITGPNHKRLLWMSLFCGGIFLMIADLLCRTIIKPLELPIGVISSMAGTLMFLYFFCRKRGNR